MDQSTTSLVDTVASKVTPNPVNGLQLKSSPHTIQNLYNLSLKYFMNKNFSKSFELIKPLFHSSFDTFAKGGIPEKLFIKIINLYLLQAGLFIDKEKSEYQLPKPEIDNIIQELMESKLFLKLEKLYIPGFSGRADYSLAGYLPSEILYNLFLTTYVNREIIFGSNTFSDLTKRLEECIYSVQSNLKTDQFVRKLIDLYVFEVLPSNKEYDKARTYIRSSDAFEDSIDLYIVKIDKIEIEAKNLEEKKKSEKAALAAKAKEQAKLENEKQAEAKKQQDLKYRTLNDIRKKASKESQTSTPTSVNNKQKLTEIQKRLSYTMNLVQNYVKDNGQAILLVVLAVVLGTRYLKSNRINLKDRIKDTIQMALKVSYV